MGVRRNFSEGEHFADRFQVADDAMQMDFHKTLCPFYITKKMPCVTATVTKIALRWRNHASFHTVKKFVTYRYQQSLYRCITCHDVCILQSHAVVNVRIYWPKASSE